MPETTKTSLNAGELSDEIAGRIDLSKFNMGCEVLENARVLRAGGSQRRAGFQHVGFTLQQDRKTRIVGFRFGIEAEGIEQGVALELSHNTMRVIRNGVIEPTVYATPWTEDQVFALQFAQRIDRIVVTHPEVKVHNIIRFNDGTWGVSEHPWDVRVWETPPTANNTLTVRATALTGDTTVVASADAFTDWQVGDRIRIDHTQNESLTDYNSDNAISGATTFDNAAGVYAVGDKLRQSDGDGGQEYFTATQAYDGATDSTGATKLEDYPLFFGQGVVLVPPTAVQAGWVFETFGTWDGAYWVQRSFNNGTTWETIQTVTSDNTRNERVTDMESESVLIRVVIPQFVSSNETSQFTVNDFSDFGSAIVTAVTSPTELAVTVEKDFRSLQLSTVWLEEAFSPRNGYPSGVTFYQSRLCFGGTKSRPQTVWLSRSQAPFDFTIGTLATDGMTFETDAEGYEAITWLSSHLSLLVGTTIGVWAISAPDGSTLSPENNAINRQMQLGAQPGFQGVPLQNNVLFLQYKGRKIQELTGGSVEYGGYLSSDLTQLASHVTRQGVDQMVAGELPDSALYLVAGGELPVLTYERSQNVVGWARWKTPGQIKSFAITTGAGEEDDRYWVVERDGLVSIERQAADMLRIEEANDVVNLRFLDGYVERVEEEEFQEITVPEEWEGQVLESFLDGEPLGELAVEDGVVTFPRTGKNAIVGRPFISEARPMPIDFGSIGSKSTMKEVIIRFRNTLGGETSQDRIRWSAIEQMQPRITADQPLSLLSDDAKSSPFSTWSRRPSISIRQTQPFPMTILAMRIKTNSTN